MDDAVQCDGENEVRCAQGQEFEMVNGYEVSLDFYFSVIGLLGMLKC